MVLVLVSVKYNNPVLDPIDFNYMDKNSGNIILNIFFCGQHECE